MRLLVSAGPTREYFDSVRFLSNPSTGKMGYAIARAAVARGHQVILVSGPVSLRAPAGVRVVPVTTAAEMASACKAAARRVDAVVMTAAVCDYRPARRFRHKLPKHATSLHVTLEPTEDIAAALGRRKGRRVLVGFAMEDGPAPRRRAEGKCRRKNCDFIVLNGLRNVGSDDALIEIYDPRSGWSPRLRGSKAVVAGRLVREIEKRLLRTSASLR